MPPTLPLASLGSLCCSPTHVHWKLRWTIARLSTSVPLSTWRLHLRYASIFRLTSYYGRHDTPAGTRLREAMTTSKASGTRALSTTPAYLQEPHVVVDRLDSPGKKINALPRLQQWRCHSSRQARKARRRSRPAQIVDIIAEHTPDLYSSHRRKPDKSYSHSRDSAHPRRPGILSELAGNVDQPHKGSLSLYGILARFLDADTMSPLHLSDFPLSARERSLLRSKGLDIENVEQWATCLLNADSVDAAAVFAPGKQEPPLFVLLMFLRRKHIRKSALAVTLKHVERRMEAANVDARRLAILIVRLLRHARREWPEAIPRIAELFDVHATRIYEEACAANQLSTVMISRMSNICNLVLSLLALPASLHPVISKGYQEQAQFQILRFMASRQPALALNKVGFRAVIKVQLARKKTPQEQEWALLKAPSWPPWKQNRTAMDEEKGPEFGLTRASQILQRMHQAGYASQDWERLAEIFAGWDTDRSPTIQTRLNTNIGLEHPYRYRRHMDSFHWAARITTTRTRREAWACFLACEASSRRVHHVCYRAMFEKLHYPEVRPARDATERSPEDVNPQGRPGLLPGDMKEVLPEPLSPLDLTYVSEPVPTWEQLHQRMMERKSARPRDGFLVFLLDSCPAFDLALKLLDGAASDFDGAVGLLLEGTLVPGSPIDRIPVQFVAAFIRLLLRHGHLRQPASLLPIAVDKLEHRELLFKDPQYRVDYAYAVLMHCKPQYRPVWTAYMKKIVDACNVPRSLQQGMHTYHVLDAMLSKMQEVDLELDGEQFSLLCAALRSAIVSATRTQLRHHSIIAQRILTESARRIRTLFHGLVGATDPDSMHVPGPDVLHAYARLLGRLHDYEGLYSLVSWIASHHVAVDERANAQHGGPLQLRKTLVAIAVSIERPESRFEAPTELVQLIKQQVQVVQKWGGWPTQKELDMYAQKAYKTRDNGKKRP